MLPLLHHNPESLTPSSDVAIPESSSPETTIPSSYHSPLPTSSSSSPSATSKPSHLSPILTLDEPPLRRSLVIFNLLHDKKTTTCLSILIILRRNQVLVKVQDIFFLFICLFFVFLHITMPFYPLKHTKRIIFLRTR